MATFNNWTVLQPVKSPLFDGHLFLRVSAVRVSRRINFREIIRIDIECHKFQILKLQSILWG